LSKREITGTRDLAYSHWHRGHWGGHPDASCTYSDVDGLEYCAKCAEPLMLVETAIGDEDTLKEHRAFYRLAERADISAVLVFYERGPLTTCSECGYAFHRLPTSCGSVTYGLYEPKP